MTRSNPLTRAERIARLGAAVAVLGALGVIWWPSIPPAQDAPSHLGTLQVMLEPQRFAGFYDVALSPTAQGFTLPGYLFGTLVGPVVGGKLALSAMLALLVAGCARLARQAQGSVAVAIAAAAAFAVGWTYAMGFWNFLAALALGVAGLAVWSGPSVAQGTEMQRDAEASASPTAARRRRLVRGITVVLLWSAAIVSHAIAAGMILAQALVEWAADAHRRGRQPIDAALAIVPGVIGVALLIGAARAQSGVSAQMSAEWAPLLSTLRNVAATSTLSYSTLGWAVAPALLVALVAVREPTPLGRVRTWSALGWGLAFFAIPLHAEGWFFASPRVLPLALLLPICAGRWRHPVFAPALAWVIALSCADGARVAAKEGERLEQSVASFGEAPVGRAYLITYAPEARHLAAPYVQTNVGTGRYATWAGGADPGHFAYNPNAHSILFHGGMEALFPATRSYFMVVDAACLADADCAANDRWRADRASATAMRWDSVVLTEVPDAFRARLIERGFVAESRGVLRPQPARVEVSLPLPTDPQGRPVPLPGPVIYRAGFPETIGYFRGGVIAPEQVRGDTLSLEFDALPAGTLQFEVFIDADASGAPSPPDIALVPPHTREVRPGEVTQLRRPERR